MNQELLTSKRIEQRLLLPWGLKDDLDKNLPAFQEYVPIIDGERNPVTLSVYFGRDNRLNKRGLIRTRQYIPQPHNDLLYIDDSEPVQLELKAKIDEIIHKKQAPATYGIAREVLMNPKKFSDHFSVLGKDSLILDFEFLLEEFRFLPLYPILAIQYLRRHLHPVNPELPIRITLDDDIHYYAFRENMPHKALIMGQEGMSKLEVKYIPTMDYLALPIIQGLIELGATPITTLQDKVEAMYVETIKMFVTRSNYEAKPIESRPLHSLRDLVLIDELPGKEIEVKFQIDPQDSVGLLEIIKDSATSGKMTPFQLVEGKEAVSFWIYFFDNYAHQTDDGLEESFVIVRHPNKPRFFIKTKRVTEKSNISHNGIIEEITALCRTEEVTRVDRTFDESDRKVIVAIQQERLKKKVNFIGTTARTKYYLFVRHQGSGRYYNISADLCECNDSTMSQLEIEYKGNDSISEAQVSPEAILTEMKVLIGFLQNISTFSLSPTTLRKFDWLKQLQGIK